MGSESLGPGGGVWAEEIGVVFAGILVGFKATGLIECPEERGSLTVKSEAQKYSEENQDQERLLDS